MNEQTKQERRAATILHNLGRQGWKISAGFTHGRAELISLPEFFRPGLADAPVYTLSALRELEGGHVKIEVEGRNPIVLVDDLLALCQGLVVTA